MEYVTNNMIHRNDIPIPSNYISQGHNFYNSFVNALKELKEIISSNVKKMVQNEEQRSSQLVLDIKESFVSIEDILSKSPLFEDEYYTFSSIKDMSFYILDDKSFYDYLGMILDLITNFFDLITNININYNKTFMDKTIFEEYVVKQEEFSLFLSKYEQKFYTEICEPSEYYDEKTLSEITNSLLDL